MQVHTICNRHLLRLNLLLGQSIAIAACPLHHAAARSSLGMPLPNGLSNCTWNMQILHLQLYVTMEECP